jgi:hypothetical protein
MTTVIRERMTASIEGDFCVFLIGMRVNKWWKPHKWLPLLLSMPPMIKELYTHPELGFLGAQTIPSIPPVIVQYWRSFEALEAYAKMRDGKHLPVWAAFNRKIGQSGDVGIWHETYLVRAGEYESIYNNMPPHGLAKATAIAPASGARESARGRLGR